MEMDDEEIQKKYKFIEYLEQKKLTQIKQILQENPNFLTEIKRNSDGACAFHIACESSSIEFIQEIDKISNYNSKNWEILDFSGRTPLFYGFQKLKTIEYLKYKHNINLDHQDKEQRTVFYNACCDFKKNSDERMQCLNFLIQNGVNINQKISTGRFPLAKASYYGHIEIVQLLLNHKYIDINQLDDKNRTALHNAVIGVSARELGKFRGKFISECYKATQLLIDNSNIQINLQDFQGNTPLHIINFTNAENSVHSFNAISLAKSCQNI